MKKFKNVLTAAILLMSLASCTATYEMVTNNPMGDANGKSGGSVFNKDLDYSVQKAAKKGKIEKISTAKITVTYVSIPIKYETIVTGNKIKK